MSTLRLIGRGSLYLALVIFLSWLVIVLAGANRIPLISVPIHLNELLEFIIFFSFAVALSIGALIREFLRDAEPVVS